MGKESERFIEKMGRYWVVVDYDGEELQYAETRREAEEWLAEYERIQRSRENDR